MWLILGKYLSICFIEELKELLYIEILKEDNVCLSHNWRRWDIQYRIKHKDECGCNNERGCGMKIRIGNERG